MSGEFLWAQEADAARADAMMTRSTRENFPVALRMLPASRRRHLMAVYGFARITDDIGDEAPPAERSRMLDELEEDLGRLKDGQARLPVIRALEPTVAEERSGTVPNVVFPTAIEEIDGQRFVFYGMADAAIGVAKPDRAEG